MRAVDSAVNDRHADAGAVESRVPGGGRLNGLDVPLQIDEGLVTGRDSAFFQFYGLYRLLPLDDLIRGDAGEFIAGLRACEKVRRVGSRLWRSRSQDD